MPLRELLCWVVFLGMARTAVAEVLAPLRVDPALLGGPAAAKGEAAGAGQLPAAATAAPPAPPVAMDVPQRIDDAAALPQAAALPAKPVAAAADRLPEASLTQSTEPPLIAERPVLAPLYSAYVAAGELPAPKLKSTAALTPLPRDSTERRPNFLSADRIHGHTDDVMVAEGDAELRKVGTVLDADTITYWSLDDEVEALGNVRLQHDQDVFTGPKLRMNVEENTGVFEQPQYTMPRTTKIQAGTTIGDYAIHQISVPITAQGEAERIDFQGENLYSLSKATFSTCAAGNQDWVASAANLNLDYNREVAEGSDGKVVFKGVPILYSPWLNFPLDNQRKSGFLAPTLGSTNTGGGEISLPWYWDIAPDKDATIMPRVMQKRGVQWNTEYRYLGDSLNPASPYINDVQLEYLPDDLVTHKNRYAYSVVNSQNFGNGFTGNLNLNGVSDGTYFTDLSKPGAIAPSTYMLRQGQLAYSADWWSASAVAQRYQVLQDPALPPVVPLYSRLPQLNLAANRYDLPLGAVFNFSGEAVDFAHPTSVIGWRETAYPQLSFPMQNSYFQVTPKVGVSVTRYELERQDPSVPSSQVRTVPIVSLDSSMNFERNTDWFGQNLTQTLEPRLYYLYVPYRDQSQIPVFDTGLADFNFSQIFAENRYAGGDRIGDTNQVTAAVTSRLVDPETGAELIRGAIGQRYYFSDQRVILPTVIAPDGSIAVPGETPRIGHTSDILAALSGQVMPKTYVDTGWDYDPQNKTTQQLTLVGRYQPEIGKVVNAGYRYMSDLLGQIDVSAQWPLGGGWHVVGRYNYSTKDRQLIQTIGGLEYDAGCWVARIVVQSISTQFQQAMTSLFVQLELNGFSRLGSNPLDILMQSVPGYSLVNQPPVSSVYPHK